MGKRSHVLRQTITKALGLLFAIAVKRKMFFLILPLFRFLIIKERRSDGSEIRFVQKSSSTKEEIIVLALGADGFRGDLEMLATAPNMTVLRVNREWQYRLISSFYSPALQAAQLISIRHNNAQRTSDPEVWAAKKQSQEFFFEFLGKLYKKLHVRAVILYNNRFLADLDWADVSSRLGVKSIILFREIPSLIKSDIKLSKERLKLFGKFRGDHIIVAIEGTKKCFVEPGFARDDQVTVCGIMRMDRLIRMPKATQTKKTPPVIVMFWWSILLYDSPEWRRLSYDALRAFVDLAKENPNAKFIIKPKPVNLWSKEAFADDRVNSVKVIESKNNTAELPLDKICTQLYPNWEHDTNLVISPYKDVHELISEASVVCGVQSLTLLESALVGLPVVVPFFDYFRKSADGNRYAYERFLGLFDATGSVEEFKEKILWRLSDARIDVNTQRRREGVFSKEVCDLSGTAVERTANLIRTLTQSG
jgi:hypothetical protein